MNARMKEVWIAVHKMNADRAMGRLQAMGLVHLSYEPSESIPATPYGPQLEKLEYIINFPHFERAPKDPLENFVGLDKRLEVENVRELAGEGLANIYAYEGLKELESMISEKEKRKAALETLVKELKGLKFTTDLPLHLLGETKNARLFLSKKPVEEADCEQVGKELYLCSMHKSQQLSIHPIELNVLGLTGTKEEIIAKAEKEQKALEIETRRLISKARLHQTSLDSFRAAFDYLSAKKARSDAMRRSLMTPSAVLLHGWVKASDEDKLLSLEDCEFESRDPEGDNAPTLLENPEIIKPLETVTKVFGVPKYTEVDPTPYLSVFFVISMALCLTDAGYGLMLTILAAGLYLRYGLRFSVLLFYGGVLAIVVGALIGGWWGNLGAHVPLFRPILFPNGIAPMDFLVLSLGIGLLQIMFSLLISAREKIRSGQLDSALFDNAPWVVFLLSVVSFALDSAGFIHFKEGLYIAGGCVAFVMLTRGRNEKSLASKIITGLVAPYDLVAYMGDTLSYSRLLALGITSGLIASAINLIAILSFGIPVIGILLAPLILIVGHTFNLLLSTLSAYIHSSRLQYVEFFNRFYSGGGFAFQPFSKDYKYVKEV